MEWGGIVATTAWIVYLTFRLWESEKKVDNLASKLGALREEHAATKERLSGLQVRLLEALTVHAPAEKETYPEIRSNIGIGLPNINQE